MMDDNYINRKRSVWGLGVRIGSDDHGMRVGIEQHSRMEPKMSVVGVWTTAEREIEIWTKICAKKGY